VNVHIAKQERVGSIACGGIYSQYTHNITCDKEYPMSKAGMRRPSPKEPHGTESNHKMHIPKNDVKPVPELSGKAKHTKEKSKPINYK